MTVPDCPRAKAVVNLAALGTEKRERQKTNRQLRLEELQKQERRDRTKKRVFLWAGIILVGGAALYGISLLVSRNDDDNASATPTTVEAIATSVAPSTTIYQPTTVPGATLTGPTACPNADGSSPRTILFESAPPTCIDPAKTYKATVKTNKGELTMDLDATKAPLAVNNLVVLSRYHYYDGVLCHRIIESFVVQCGDPTGTGAGPNPGYTFADELPQAGEYKVGSLAMANAGPDTNGSQFFIITGDQGVALPPSYSLFGQVGAGLDTTVRAMEAAAGPPGSGVPTAEPIYIESVTISES